MKKTVFAMGLLFCMSTFVVSAQKSSTDGDYPVIKQKNEYISAGKSTFNALIVQDKLPWGFNEIAPILSGLGANVTILTSSMIATEDFSQYELIVIASEQEDSFVSNYNASVTKFNNYVTNGGRLEIHTARIGLIIPAYVLPGGLSFGAYNAIDDNDIADVGHPLVAGITPPLKGSFASHQSFTSLPAGATIITTEEFTGLPTTVEYTLGGGVVIATCMPWEYLHHYKNIFNSGQMLVNSLTYLFNYVTFPYIATLVVLIFTSKKSAAPRAAGKPYDQGQR